MQDVSKTEGRTVLFVSHNMASVKNLCKSGVLLENGMTKMIGGIDEVVEEYITGNLREVGDVDVITNPERHRIGPQTKEIEILSARRLVPYIIDSNDLIEYELRLKRNLLTLAKFQITTMLDNVGAGGTRVGMAFSDEITWPIGQEEITVKVSVPEHHLTRGKYILDIWVCTGDVLSSFKTYDSIYDTLTLKVETIDRKQINEWHDYWGETLYKNTVELL